MNRKHKLLAFATVIGAIMLTLTGCVKRPMAKQPKMTKDKAIEIMSRNYQSAQCITNLTVGTDTNKQNIRMMSKFGGNGSTIFSNRVYLTDKKNTRYVENYQGDSGTYLKMTKKNGNSSYKKVTNKQIAGPSYATMLDYVSNNPWISQPPKIMVDSLKMQSNKQSQNYDLRGQVKDKRQMTQLANRVINVMPLSKQNKVILLLNLAKQKKPNAVKYRIVIQDDQLVLFAISTKFKVGKTNTANIVQSYSDFNSYNNLKMPDNIEK